MAWDGGALKTRPLPRLRRPFSHPRSIQVGEVQELAATLGRAFSGRAVHILTKVPTPRRCNVARRRESVRGEARENSVEGGDDRAGWPKRLRRLALAMMAEEGGRRNDGCPHDWPHGVPTWWDMLKSEDLSVFGLSSNEAEGEVLKKLLWNALGHLGLQNGRADGGSTGRTGLDQSSVAPVSALGEPDDPKLAKPERWCRSCAEGHSDECDVVIAQRKSALLFAPQGKYFQVALTNCTPQGVVGTLMLHMAMLQGTLDPSSDQAVELLMKQLWTREISMKAFVEAVLPGEVSPGSVQAALYVQGLRYHSDMDPRPGRGAKQRRGGLAPLSAPEQILHTLAREQRHLAYLERNRATEHGSLETERRTAPGALTTVDDTDVYSGSMLESHPNGSRKELFTRGSQVQD
ncbi:Hypothetical protein SCF082_LOCUS1729 [Durusdinium trenchii]|uniref:Uncharacterized protein n=1 Tax=Durusdinium trenchii TaxID=1381693 RepID=A0ABP0HGB0_9DINO